MPISNTHGHNITITTHFVIFILYLGTYNSDLSIKYIIILLYYIGTYRFD